MYKRSNFNYELDLSDSLLLVNSRTGAILKLDSDYRKFYQELSVRNFQSSKHKDLISALMEGGFILTSDRNEIAELRI